MADAREGLRVGANIPSVKGETGYTPWIVQQLEVVGCCPRVQALTVRRCCPATPVEIANVQNGVWERRDSRGCESREWWFVDVNGLVSCKITVSDCSGNWSTSVHSNCSRTNVARPCFMLRTDPASERLGITNLSAVVQWVSRRTMTNASFL